MEVCSAGTPQTACAPPQSINININMASHLKVALGWSRIQNIIRDHDTFLMRSTAEWMHCLAVVICKIQSSYSTKSYFQRDGRLAGPNGCCLKPLGRWGFFFYAELREKGPHILLYQGTDSQSHYCSAIIMPEKIISADNYYHRLTAPLHSTHPHNTDHRSFWHSSKSPYSPSFFSCRVFVTFLCEMCATIFDSSEVRRHLNLGLYINFTYKQSSMESAVNTFSFAYLSPHI